MSATASRFSKLSWLKRTNGHKLPLSELRVLLSIYNHSDGEGRGAYPGGELIAEEACLTRTTVSTAIQRLIAGGWIREVSKGSGFNRLNSTYELIPDAPMPPRCSSSGEPHGLAGGELCGSAVADTNQILVTDPRSDPVELRVPEVDPKHGETLLDPATYGPDLSSGEVMRVEPSALGEASVSTDDQLGRWPSFELRATPSEPTVSSGTPWPRDRPIPDDPWGRPYVDEITGEHFQYTPGELPRLASTEQPQDVTV